MTTNRSRPGEKETLVEGKPENIGVSMLDSVVCKLEPHAKRTIAFYRVRELNAQALIAMGSQQQTPGIPQWQQEHIKVSIDNEYIFHE